MTISEEFKKFDGVWMAELKGRPVGESVVGQAIESICPVVEFLYANLGDGLKRTRSVLCGETLALLSGGMAGQPDGQVSGGAAPQAFEWTRIPSVGSGYVDQNDWVSFCLRFDKSARQAGCSIDQAKTLVAAMRELASNVHDHSGAPESMLLAYQARAGHFEFSIADSGIGVLASLRQCNEYVLLPDSQGALRALLTGASRHGAGHGSGYKEVFRVLERCAGFVRCRSGDAALLWATGGQALIVQRPPLPGLVVSVGVEKSD